MLSWVCFCQDFILEHYSEDGNNYEDEIADLMDLRQVDFIRFTPLLSTFILTQSVVLKGFNMPNIL